MVMEEVGPLLVSMHKWSLCGITSLLLRRTITSGFIFACLGGQQRLDLRVGNEEYTRRHQII